MQYYKYGKKETDYLKERDSKLGREIDRIGIVKREVNPDIFDSLIASIISQQISTKAAFTVKNRLKESVGEITPETISKLDIESIQLCGMTMRKAKYIKNITQAVVSKTINLDNLNLLSDEEIINELIKFEGVGKWTAEMLLIHSFQRPDILSYNDLGIQRGLKKLYSLEDISKEEFETYRKKIFPLQYGSIFIFMENIRRLINTSFLII